MSNGSNIHQVDPYYLQALSEHRELHFAVDRIRRILEECPEIDASGQSIAELTRGIADLRDLLERHFLQEEEGGYLEEAIARSPQAAPQALVLHRQHGDLLGLANGMLAAAIPGESAPIVWMKLKADYLRFAKRLNAHEAAEDSLLQRAFNEDPGTAF